MKCANCGNEDSKTLFDDEELFYCSKCHHRTRKRDGKDDLIKCPVCGRMRDRTAYCCWWCNSIVGAEKDMTKEELNSARQNANEFAKSEDSNNIIYKKIR